MSKTRTITPNPPADFVPSKNDVSYLRPFRVWCQKVLPLVYDDSLSYYELLCKVVDYLNKTMEEVNQLGVDVSNLFNAFRQLQDYVNNYFDNLDVQEEINNKLDQMVEDGVMTGIVMQLGLFSSNTLQVTRLYRHASKTGDYIGSNTELDWGQAICVVGDKAITACYNSKHYTNNVNLTETTLNGNLLVRSVTVENLGHCNWITYNPKNNKLYVSVLTVSESGNETATNDIVILDYSTLSYIETIEAPTYMHSMCYDKKTGRTICLGGEKHFYEFDYETNEFTEMFELEVPISNYTLQGASVNNNTIYLVITKPNAIISYDLEGNPLKFYSPKNWYDIYYFGELESIDFDDDMNMYLYSVTYNAYANYRFNQVWKTNLITGYLSLYSPSFTPLGETLYVDGSYTGLNPDGSSNKPFKYVEEAIISYNGEQTFSTLSIANNTYNEFIYTNNPISVIGNGSTVYSAILNRCTYALFDGLKFINTTTDNNCVRSFNCGIVIIKDSEMQTTNNSTLIVNTRGLLALTGNLTFNSENDIWINNDSPFPVKCNKNINYKIADSYPSSGGTPVRFYISLSENGTYNIPTTTLSALKNSIYTQLGITVRSSDINTYQEKILVSLYEGKIPSDNTVIYDFGCLFTSSAGTLHVLSGSFNITTNGLLTLTRLKEYYLSNGTLEETASKPVLIALDFE